MNVYVENAIQICALGRKNYLFAGSHEAAQRSSIFYSLLGTCKIHGIEPYNWLRNILEKIATHSSTRSKNCYPHNCK
ncbi:MAG: transposase domain-containing protein [Chitinophagaceae bacterium]|nr:transposase domain-containing protein [Chitinophagaceae bacterium]